MSKIRIPWKAVICCGALVCLIVDSRCVTQAAAQAIVQCAASVIPSLFPMFVLSGYALPMLSAISLVPVARFCHLPPGSEGIFVMGLLGGFPVGAQCIANASISQKDAQRMLGFCSNCGPAFLFGIVGSAFSHKSAPWALMAIQTLSALTVGALWYAAPQRASVTSLKPVRLTQAVQNALHAMASVCAWVILGNVMLAFIQRWLAPFFPAEWGVVISGMLELTTGCMRLTQIPSESMRFMAAAGMICFGGSCVLLQIHAMVSHQNLSMIPCILQKMLQGVLGVMFAAIYLAWGALSLPLLFAVILLVKKAVEKLMHMQYNSPDKGGNPYAVSQTN